MWCYVGPPRTDSPPRSPPPGPTFTDRTSLRSRMSERRARTGCARWGLPSRRDPGRVDGVEQRRSGVPWTYPEPGLTDDPGERRGRRPRPASVGSARRGHRAALPRLPRRGRARASTTTVPGIRGHRTDAGPGGRVGLHAHQRASRRGSTRTAFECMRPRGPATCRAVWPRACCGPCEPLSARVASRERVPGWRSDRLGKRHRLSACAETPQTRARTHRISIRRSARD